ncbi:MAG: SUMF1/EgtB/PvdO family nonheme iron enzyme [Candidatus Delongbacteria bacterium]|jgi:formylglycine-generating enzyme required for sulfatase activity|nr:SUMF1/EgtB/PvdO family nonheme iron enzyme [Candidatus Delongbacteria bacterium]
MICPECKTLNPNSIKKCIKCGAKLEKSAAPKKKPEKRTSIKPQKQAALKPAKVQKQRQSGGEEKKKGKGLLIIILLILAGVGAFFTKPDFASFKDFLAAGIETNQEDIFYQLLAKDEFISKGLVDSLEYQDLYVCAIVEIETKLSNRKFLGIAKSWYDITSQPATTDTLTVAEADTVSLDDEDGNNKRNKVYDEYNDIYLGKKSKGPQDTTLYKSLSDADAAQRNKKKRKANEKIYYARDNKKMVLVPAQTFKMGSDDGSIIEKPSHNAKVRAFYMDATEVTNVQFKRFLKESKYKPKGALEHLKDRRFNHDSQPIVDVAYYDAVAYAKWAEKRLPTEREWECAAQGGKGYKYAVGDTITTDIARYAMPITTGSPIKVGSYKANEYDIYDLSGNVEEWVSGVLTAYPGNKDMFSGYGKNRIGRGGSWFSEEAETTSYSRKLLNISNSTGNIGFRCAIGHDQVMKLENH